MYYQIKEDVFEGLLAAALEVILTEETAAMPSDEELAERYPVNSKRAKLYQKKAKAKKYRLPMPLVYARRTAVVFLATVTLLFGVLLTDNKVRSSISGAVVYWHDKFVSIDLSSSEAVLTPEDKRALDFVIGYIPEGYERIEDEMDAEYDTYIYHTYLRDGDENTMLMIMIAESKNTSIGLDSEHGVYTERNFNGYEGYVMTWDYDNGATYTSVVFGDSRYTINVDGWLPAEEIIKIADNIK